MNGVTGRRVASARDRDVDRVAECNPYRTVVSRIRFALLSYAVMCRRFWPAKISPFGRNDRPGGAYVVSAMEALSICER